MSITEKQLATNRKNDKKSTGPKTEDGKVTVCRNNTRGFFNQEQNEKKDVKICETNPIHWTINRHIPLHDFSTSKKAKK